LDNDEHVGADSCFAPGGGTRGRLVGATARQPERQPRRLPLVQRAQAARSPSAIAFSSASSDAAAVVLVVVTSPLSCGRRSAVRMSSEPTPRLARMNGGWVLFD
jgi:hypothetical protein